MALIDDVKKFQIVFDYLYWTNQLNEKNQNIYKNIRNKQYSSIPEEHSVYKNAAIDFLGILNIDFNKLLSLALQEKEGEVITLNLFKTIIAKQPELKEVIEQAVQNIKQSYPEESQFAKRQELYKNFYNSLTPKLQKDIRNTPEEKETIKKNLDSILSVYGYIMNKLSMAQQKKIHEIEGRYLNTNEYYSDEHIDELINFYNSLPLPPLDTMMAKMKKGGANKPSPANFENLNIIKKLPVDVIKNLISDVNYLQNMIRKKISFGEEGQTTTPEEITRLLGNIDKPSLNTALHYVPKLEKLTGQKIIFE